MIQVDFCKGFQYTEEHNGSFLRKVVVICIFIWYLDTAFFLAFLDANPQKRMINLK